jgi:tetratricopeptide (TPR) repeat protein
MSKPMVVTLPCVLLLLDFWPLQRFSASTLQRLIIEKIPFFILAAASCVVTMVAQKHALWSPVSLPFQFRLANALMSYVRYISKIFLPTDLALIYPYPHSWPLVGVVAAGTVLCLLTIVFVLQAKRFPYLVVGWFWYLGTLVPAIGLVQAGVQAMADRYTYLPSIGIFILVTWGISDLVASSPRKFETCALAGALALGACVVLTSIQLTYWRDSQAIFRHTVDVTTDNYAADDCLGKTLQNMGDKIDAEKCFEQAVSLEPTYPMAQFDLGMNLLKLGDPDGAGQHLSIAVQLYPTDPVMQYDFGVFLLQHGHPKEAEEHLKAALAINPDFTQARKELESLNR